MTIHEAGGSYQWTAEDRRRSTVEPKFRAYEHFFALCRSISDSQILLLGDASWGNLCLSDSDQLLVVATTTSASTGTNYTISARQLAAASEVPTRAKVSSYHILCSHTVGLKFVPMHDDELYESAVMARGNSAYDDAKSAVTITRHGVIII